MLPATAEEIETLRKYTTMSIDYLVGAKRKFFSSLLIKKLVHNLKSS